MSTSVAISPSVLKESRSIPAAVNASSVGANTVMVSQIVLQPDLLGHCATGSWFRFRRHSTGYLPVCSLVRDTAGEANNMAVISKAASAGLAFINRVRLPVAYIAL